jgi:hypothetical protein
MRLFNVRDNKQRFRKTRNSPKLRPILAHDGFLGRITGISFPVFRPGPASHPGPSDTPLAQLRGA